jgi:hypothetical protein
VGLDRFPTATEPDLCPECSEPAADDPWCPFCGYVLDAVEVAAIERDTEHERRFDELREMEMEG